MKTFSEQQNAINETRRRFRDERITYNRETVAKIRAMSIPVFVSSEKGNRTGYEAVREGTRKNIESDRPDGSWSDVACDHCGVELWKESGMRMSNPPCRQYLCPGCGWIGFGAP